VAFISSDNRPAIFIRNLNGRSDPDPSGDIWILDLSSKDSEPRPLNVDIGSPFNPHGIDLLQLENGARELYVVNHPTHDDHEILIFTVNEDHTLKLKRRIHYPELISPNDIKAIASEQFFVTNDHGSPSSAFMSRVEEYLGLSRSSVTYFDGSEGSFLLKGIKSANGIMLSKNQDTLYVAEAIGRGVKRFKRGDSIRQWEYIDKISVNTGVDNLEWSDEGKLLATGHPKLFDLLAYVKDNTKNSPSEVISIDVEASPVKYETIYMNDGAELSGATVAGMLNGELLIGALLEPHFLRCAKK